MELYQKTPPNPDRTLRNPVGTIRESGAIGADESTNAFNPYLPAIGRVLEVLRSYGPSGTTVEICNRDLAASAGCSAGRIPALLRQLEADDMIERVTGPRGSLIMVSDQHVDRSNSALACDQESDRRSTADPSIPNQMLDRSAAAVVSDQFIDPPHTPLYGIQHESSQQQHARGRESLYDAILAANEHNEGVALDVLEKNPELTLAEFQALCRAGAKRGSRRSKNSIGLVIWCLQHGQPLHSPKEPRDERSAARSPSTGTPRRSAPNRSEQAADPALGIDVDALIAEWQRTEPLGPIAMRLPGQRSGAHGD